MSDDLISRKAAVELVIAEYDRFQANGGSHSGRHELDKVIKMLQNIPTVFDKEKVIEELKGEIELCVTHPLYPGRYIKKSRSIEIIEKGGIE